MTVIAPSDATQTKRIVHLMAEQNGPIYARVGRADAPLIYDNDDVNGISLGKGLTVKDGDDITFLCCGTMVEPALEAREALKNSGISARVIDMHTIKPLDERLVKRCAKETNAIITAEEHSIIGGLGAAVSEILTDNSIYIKLKRMGIKDRFCESGSPPDLLEKYELNKNYMVKFAKKMLKN
jgi:transketolase